MKRKTCPECGASFGGGESKIGAADSDQAIREMYRNGRNVQSIADEMDMPEPVIAEWVQREESTGGPEESEASGADSEAESMWSGEGSYRCSHCSDVVPRAEMEEHEDECLRGADWGQLS